MKRPFLSLSIFVSVSGLFLRCAPIYTPTAHNVPMFSGKGEFQTSVSVGTSVNGQAGYAISDHIGISTNYLYERHKESKNGRKHQAAEFGLGYYNNISERWCFEIFGGYGFGKGSAYDSLYAFPLNLGLSGNPDDRYEANGKYNKVFIQPSIGLRKGNFTFYFSGKISHVDFSRINLIYGGDEIVVKRKSMAFFSFAQGMRVCVLWDKLFIQYQGGFNIPIRDDPEYDFNFFMGSLGLVFIPNLPKGQ